MRPILTQALADVARRRLQTIVVFLIVAMAMSVGAMGGTLLVQSSSPYDRVFAELSGPHLLVFFDGTKITRDQVAATASGPGVTRSAGPWLATNVPFEVGGDKFVLRVQGRDQAGSRLDREELVAGRWVEAPDEIVVTHATAIHHRLSVGDHITVLGTPAKPVLTLVGEAIDVDPRPGRSWVQSSQVANLNPVGTPVGYEMAYSFRSATTRADIRSDLNALQATVPAGAVAGHASYLDFRDSFNFTNSLVLTFLLAFAAMGLGAVAVIVGNVVTGAVIASYREIGIMKAIGFTPGQVVMVFVIQMIVPGLAAGLVGVPLGALASKPLLGQATEAIGLPAPSAIVPGVDLLVLAVTLAVVAAAAALPAWRAGGLNPVVAITTGTAPSGRWSASLHGRLGWWRLPRPLVIGAGDAFARPLRGVFTAIAILVGVATLVFASGLHSAIARFNDLFGPALNGPYQVSVARLGGYSDAATMEILHRQPETRLVVGIKQLQVAVPGEPDPVVATVYRGDSARLGYHIASGRWLNGPGEAVLGTTFNPYHWTVGQVVDLRIEGQPSPVRIVGACYCFFNLATDWSTYSSSLTKVQLTDYLVQLQPGTDANAYVKRVSTAEPDFLYAQVNRQRNNSGSGVDIELILDGLVAALALILGAIAALGVFNALLLTTRERVGDISILKALGMTPRQVSAMVISSACALGAAGAVLGLPAGIFLYYHLIDALARVAGFTLSGSALRGQLNPFQLVVVAAAGVAVAVVGATLPARWAARTPVASVLNLE